MPKLFCNFIEIILRHGCSPVNLMNVFGIPFTKNISGRLLLKKPRKIVRILKIIKTRI